MTLKTDNRRDGKAKENMGHISQFTASAHPYTQYPGNDPVVLLL